MSKNISLLIKKVRLYEMGELSSPVNLLIDNGKLIKKIDDESSYLLNQYSFEKVIDAKSCMLSRGLTDCHTHLIYAGNRSHEFEMRLEGLTYEQIARQGGGIKSTVEATRAATYEQLYLFSKRRIQAMISQGCLNFEIKSGYGLDLETECRMLRVARALGEEFGVNISTTYLGAHTLPSDFAGRSSDYISYVCQEVLPRIKAENLADSVDVFCESIGFNLTETEQVFNTAIDLGFGIKCHAEQLSSFGASFMAADKGALSCDHLEYLDEKSIIKMKEKGTVAVLLPGAFYFLKETQKPPVALLKKYGVPIAIATDHNPGSSPTNSLPLMMNMACLLFNLTVNDVWQGVTKNAASALGHDIKSLEEGSEATFVLWPFTKPVDLVSSFGQQKAPKVFIKGKEQSFEESPF